MATSRAWDTARSASTVRMSGRGTMTSRTIVSPNPMMEWMSSRSWVSMTSSSMATSAMASSSDSRIPRASRLRGRMRRLARPLRPVDSSRTGGNATRAETTGATNSAERSGLYTAQFLGSASASTKITTTSKKVAANTPSAPKNRSARMPTSVAVTNWQMSTSRSTGFRNAWGFSTSRTSRPDPRRCSSAQRQRLGLAGAHERGLRQGQEGRPHEQHRHHRHQDGVGGPEMPGGEQG